MAAQLTIRKQKLKMSAERPLWQQKTAVSAEIVVVGLLKLMIVVVFIDCYCCCCLLRG